MHAEVTVDDHAAALALLVAVVAIDVAAIRAKRSTVSRWCRRQYRTRPRLAVTATAGLLLHLVAVVPGDPLREVAGRLGGWWHVDGKDER
jgi:hypothetical protein